MDNFKCPKERLRPIRKCSNINCARVAVARTVMLLSNATPFPPTEDVLAQISKIEAYQA